MLFEGTNEGGASDPGNSTLLLKPKGDLSA